MHERMERALRAAGVGALAAGPTAAGVPISPLVWELTAFGAGAATDRIERVRSEAAIDAWIGRQLAALPASTTYFVLDLWVDAPPRLEWMQVVPPADPGWLARLWRDAPSVLVVVSEDGQHVLMLQDDYAVLLRAICLPVAEVLAMHADRLRLHAALDQCPSIQCIAMAPLPHAVLASALFAGTADHVLARDASPERRAAWLVDVFSRWREQPRRLHDAWFGTRIGTHYVSLAGTPRLAIAEVFLESAAAVGELWARSGFGRLAIVAGDHSRTLAIEPTDDGFAAITVHATD